MSDPEDFLRKQFKAFNAAQDAIKTHQSLAQGMMDAQQSAIQAALKAQQPAMDVIDAFRSKGLRLQADIKTLLDPIAPSMLETIQREMKEQERLQALFNSGGVQEQIKAAVDALNMGELLRSSPEIAPEPDVRNSEYLNSMHRAAENNKAAMREYIAAEIKRQLDSRNGDKPEDDEGEPVQ